MVFENNLIDFENEKEQEIAFGKERASGLGLS